ncbi:hypothetical protein CSKR_109283 [Clonorchis sinensis]|uniref:Uncharacterized protein n=1 Tax=Clonorchis sinensis TaxID=79923 RepID=A0A3R7JTC0_CLOSI|nr:hypothetical protein CSKR_109283 [Clonorchis sinensis]
MHRFIFLYMLILIHPHICFTCPPTFRNLGESFCVVVLRRTLRFCSATEKCARYGERNKQVVYLIGRNIVRVPRLITDVRGMHTGINFLLEPPTNGNLVWRDLDPKSPEYTATEKEFNYNIRPMGQGQRYVPRWFPVEKLIRDVSAYSSYSSRIICEYGGVLPDGHRKVQFRSNFPKPLSVLVHSDARFTGCEKKMSTRTKLECARRCALKPACRSIYFEGGTSSCIHMMHADSLLSLRTAGRGSGWVRFAKTSLALELDGGEQTSD